MDPGGVMSKITRRQAMAAGIVGCAAMQTAASTLGGGDGSGVVALVKAELAALQGTWKCLRWEQEGVLMSRSEAAKVSIVIARDKYRSTTDGVSFEEGRLVIDPARTPCHLDAYYGGGDQGPTDPHLAGRHGENLRRSIYVRAGEYLTLCVGPSGEDGARPTDFVTAPGKSSVSLYVFEIRK
jgi:uncharacterized protein (TIGR03067 family)